MDESGTRVRVSLCPGGKFTVLVFNPVSIPRCKMDGPHDMERCQRLGKLAQGSDGASLNGSEQTLWFLVLESGF